MTIELTEMNSPLLEAALDAGEIDLGVLHPPLSTPALVTKSLREERLVLALPAAHRLAEAAFVKASDLQGEPILIAPRAIGPSIYDRLIAFFRRQGFSPSIVQEATPMTTLAGLVAAGVGMGFVTVNCDRRPARTGLSSGRAATDYAADSRCVAGACAFESNALFLDVVAELGAEWEA